MQIKIKKLGLAAFIKMRSESETETKFIKYDDGFVFDSPKDANEWKVEYMNDPCSRFDKNLMELREFLK